MTFVDPDESGMTSVEFVDVRVMPVLDVHCQTVPFPLTVTVELVMSSERVFVLLDENTEHVTAWPFVESEPVVNVTVPMVVNASCSVQPPPAPLNITLLASA
jgi:hypothetical protein